MLNYVNSCTKTDEENPSEMKTGPKIGNIEKKSSLSACQILSQEKCKVSELLLLCKEDPDSVMKIYKTTTGNGKCLPELELDKEKMRYFEQKFKSEKRIPTIKEPEFFKEISNETKPMLNRGDFLHNPDKKIHHNLTSDKHAVAGDNSSSQNFLLKNEVPQDIFIKNKPFCQDANETSSPQNLRSKNIPESKNNTNTKAKKSVVIMEYVELTSLLPKEKISFITDTESSKRSRKIRTKELVLEQLVSAEHYPPIINHMRESQAEAMLRQVVQEYKDQLKTQENQCKDEFNDDFSKRIKSRKWRKFKNFVSYLKVMKKSI